MVAVGVKAPGILLLSFVPMFFIAAAFYYMNRVDTDCGTTFSWVTRAMGPYAGFLGGWAICTTGILVIGSLADVSALFLFDLFDFNDLRKSDLANVVLAVVIIVVMTAICVIGTEISAHLQRVLTLGQVAILLLFAVVAFVKHRRRRRPGRVDRSRAQLALAVRGRVLRDADRRPARGVHLLGLGERRQPLRGEQGLLAALRASPDWRAP